MEARVVGVNDQAAAAAAAVDDMGDGMQCRKHPYRNNPGGICAFCLQEKLGKLVSSSFPLPIRGSSSSSSSSPPSFRSDHATAGVGHVANSNGGGLVASSAATAASLSLSLSVRPTSTSTARTRSDNGNDQYYYTTRRARIPFLLAKKKKNIMVPSSTSSAAASDRAADTVFKRSKSTTTPGRGHAHFLEAENEDCSPRKRGFWSFLYHSSSSRLSSKNKVDKITTLAPLNGGSHRGRSSLSTKNANFVIEENHDDEEEESPNSATYQATSSFERKVSRSRSVGCGSRSFSGDFFERISTGFGDCTLRRVESQREGKPKLPNNANAASHHHHHHHHHLHMKERVKCGGIFGGFIMTSSSSSSSSSSYWVSSLSADQDHHVNGKSLPHARTKAWGWAFASPMRAFGNKPFSKDGSKRSDHIIRETANKNTTPNLAAIPSLLAVRG